MPYCPNCSAELEPTEIEEACKKCGASFQSGSEWSPTSTPSQRSSIAQFNSSWTVRTIKGLFGGTLIALALGLFFISSKLGTNIGELALVPGIVCVVVASGIAFSGSRAVLAFWVVAAGAMFFLVGLAVNFVGALAYSR